MRDKNAILMKLYQHSSMNNKHDFNVTGTNNISGGTATPNVSQFNF